jgi:hypothetical protein
MGVQGSGRGGPEGCARCPGLPSSSHCDDSAYAGEEATCKPIAGLHAGKQHRVSGTQKKISFSYNLFTPFRINGEKNHEKKADIQLYLLNRRS